MSRTASASRAIGLLVVLVAVSIPLSIATNVSAHHPKSPGSYLHSIRSVSQLSLIHISEPTRPY